MNLMPEPAPDAPTLSWSLGRSRTTATWNPVHDQSWSSFIRWLKPDQPAASKEVRPYVGGTLKHGRRTIRTVEQRFFLTLDADYADVDFPFDVMDVLEGVPYVIHTTWRHLQGEYGHRYRLIIPLSRGTEPNEYKELAWTVMNRLDEMRFDDPPAREERRTRFDVTTAQAERFMWSPSTQDDTTYYWTSDNPRAPYLPVDEWLDGHHGPSDAPAAHGQGNGPPATRATSDGLLRATAEDKERATEILLKACDQVEHVHKRGDFAGRNEAVFHWMPMLFRFCGAGALDEDTVTDALWTAAQRVPADEPYLRQEFNASVRSARQYAEETGPSLPETTPTKMAQADFEDVDIVADIWDKTSILTHIAQAADSMGRNRLALLAVTLARVLVEVDPSIQLPGVEDGGVGDRAALNLGVALVGSSGQGKTTFERRSMRLLGRDQKSLRRDPSTGQGLIQAYLQWSPEAEENVLRDDPRRIWIADEVDKLGNLSTDTGSTVLSEIRTMLTGGSTGSSNATKDRQRMLHEGTYNFQIIVGVQPARAGVLLDGRDVGTPQRFIWVPVTDPKTALRHDERPEWPGSLNWTPDFLVDLLLFDPVVLYPEWLAVELKEYDYQISLEDESGGQMSRHGHQNLLRLKVAAAIAFLHQSCVIEDLHIEITDMILAASRRTQAKCEKAIAEAALLKRKKTQRNEERVREEVGVETLTRLVKNTRDKLLLKKGEWHTWQTLRPAYRLRSEYEEPLWEALVEMEDVENEVEQFGQGVRRKLRVMDDTP